MLDDCSQTGPNQTFGFYLIHSLDIRWYFWARGEIKYNYGHIQQNSTFCGRVAVCNESVIHKETTVCLIFVKLGIKDLYLSPTELSAPCRIEIFNLILIRSIENNHEQFKHRSITLAFKLSVYLCFDHHLRQPMSLVVHQEDLQQPML